MVRLLLLGAATVWSLWLGSRTYARSLSVAWLATLALGGAMVVSAADPVFMFWIW